MDHLVHRAQELAARYGPEIARLLGVAERPIQFVVAVRAPNGDQIQVAQQYGDGVVYLNPKWFKEHRREGIGAIVHEIAHWYADTDDENLVDAVRYAVIGNQAGWTATEEQMRLADDLEARADAGATPGSPTPTPSPAPTDPGAAPGSDGGNVPPTAATETTIVNPPNSGNNNTPSEVPAGTGVGTAPIGTIDLGTLGGEEDPWASKLAELFMGLWGEPAPAQWIKRAQGGEFGDSLFEIELHERQKPAFMHTKVAGDERAAYAAQVAQTLGLR
jgi:hypothetical protein